MMICIIVHTYQVLKKMAHCEVWTPPGSVDS